VRAKEESMDPRTASQDTTGTLPVSGEGAVPPVAAPDPAGRERPAWAQEARDGLTVPGKYLVYEENERVVVAPVNREWTRIGRSLAADVRFDDATVSRRHALVVSQEDGVRVLDDRSLNGVYVNGARVEWSPLSDGDEVTVGRHLIVFLDTATVGSAAAPAAVAAE
jgi:pSer/pThr/pTyr-binding forkhead associated (FHA) protein